MRQWCVSSVWLECLPVTQEVTGSSPVRTAKEPSIWVAFLFDKTISLQIVHIFATPYLRDVFFGCKARAKETRLLCRTAAQKFGNKHSSLAALPNGSAGWKKSVPFIVRLRSCLASEQSSSEGLLTTFFVRSSLHHTSHGWLTTGKWRVR